jgi:hypothetical protein
MRIPAEWLFAALDIRQNCPQLGFRFYFAASDAHTRKVASCVDVARTRTQDHKQFQPSAGALGIGLLTSIPSPGGAAQMIPAAKVVSPVETGLIGSLSRPASQRFRAGLELSKDGRVASPVRPRSRALTRCSAARSLPGPPGTRNGASHSAKPFSSTPDKPSGSFGIKTALNLVRRQPRDPEVLDP